MKVNLISLLIKKFKIEGNIINVVEYGGGLINNTFLVITDKNKYIFQKINHRVFKNPDMLMKNIDLVTKYIMINNGSTINLIKTNNDLNYLQSDNSFYRCYEMKQNHLSYEKVPNLKIALQTGKTIANFQYILRDFNVELLDITIPFFHDLRHRYIDLIVAFRNCKNKERKEEALYLIKEMLLENKDIMKLPILLEMNSISKRVCHYDTKMNNFLFDEENNLNGCLIDLDTVMPGCSLYDYGDNIRNAVVEVLEDEFEKEVKIDFKKFANITIGYLSIGKNYLTNYEIENIIESIKVIVMELSIRFLTDYLDNDNYFKIDYEKQNLHRSICQLNVYRKIKENDKRLKKIAFEIYERII